MTNPDKCPANSPEEHANRHHALQRAAVGITGMAVASVVLASVTVLFGEASSMPWLPETPSNVAAMQRCEAVAGTAARRRCAETVVSAVLARDVATRVAGEAVASPLRTPVQ